MTFYDPAMARTAMVQVRMRWDEKARCVERAEEAGMKLADWMRLKLLAEDEEEAVMQGGGGNGEVSRL